MDYNQFNQPDAERAEILYPSLRKDRPTEQNLNSRFFDAFARIAPETNPNKEEIPGRTSYRYSAMSLEFLELRQR